MESQMGDFARKKVFKWENNIQVAKNVSSLEIVYVLLERMISLWKPWFPIGKRCLPIKNHDVPMESKLLSEN